jgi:hypothetical protein
MCEDEEASTSHVITEAPASANSPTSEANTATSEASGTSEASEESSAPELDALQRNAASIVYWIAIGSGLSPERARELVAVAFAESSLYYYATNDRTGAAGLFQLFDPAYVKSATQLGGVYSPRANTYAILPDYIAYWKAHPQARPGEAGRDIERSGEGREFYSAPLAWLPKTFPKPPYIELLKR